MRREREGEIERGAEGETKALRSRANRGCVNDADFREGNGLERARERSTMPEETQRDWGKGPSTPVDMGRLASLMLSHP